MLKRFNKILFGNKPHRKVPFLENSYINVFHQNSYVINAIEIKEKDREDQIKRRRNFRALEYFMDSVRKNTNNPVN